MATYAKFERRTYNGGDFRQLLKLDRDVVQYLWESPAGSFLSSIYVIPVPMIAYHLECPDYKPTVEQVTESIRRLETNGWLEYDWKSSVVWLPRQMTIERPENRSVVVGMLRRLEELPKTYLRDKFRDALDRIVGENQKPHPVDTVPAQSPDRPDPHKHKQEHITRSSKNSLSGKPDEADGIPYGEIVADLNEVTGRSFIPTKKDTRELIRARWKEGFRVEDFQVVHRCKYQQWGSDPERKQYLRPATLYLASKFEGYLQDGKSKLAEKKPTIAQITGDYTGATERFLKEHGVNGINNSDSSLSERTGGELQPPDERRPVKRV